MPPLNLCARVRVLVRILHARPRVQRAPGFPCALIFRGTDFTQSSGTSCREIANSHPLVQVACHTTSKGTCNCVAAAPRLLRPRNSTRTFNRSGGQLLPAPLFSHTPA